MVCIVSSPTLSKWQRLTTEQRDMLCEVIRSVCDANATFEEFAETARSFMESIPGLETLTESEASGGVRKSGRFRALGVSGTESRRG
jgi:hypothetical protein